MSEKTCNGWSNYETRALALWYDMDYLDYIAGHSENDGKVASDIEKHFTDLIESALNESNGFFTDILSAALWRVNWFEIAEHLIEWREEENG